MTLGKTLARGHFGKKNDDERTNGQLGLGRTNRATYGLTAVVGTFKQDNSSGQGQQLQT